MTDMKVMLGVCGLARFGNLVLMSQGGLADALGLGKSAVSRSIKKLTDEAILLKTSLGLFINPTLIVKGGLTAIDPSIWDAALLTGSTSPVKSIAKQQIKKIKTAPLLEDGLGVETPWCSNETSVSEKL